MGLFSSLCLIWPGVINMEFSISVGLRALDGWRGGVGGERGLAGLD